MTAIAVALDVDEKASQSHQIVVLTHEVQRDWSYLKACLYLQLLILLGVVVVGGSPISRADHNPRQDEAAECRSGRDISRNLPSSHRLSVISKTCYHRKCK